MGFYPSKERVERDGYLVYPLGEPIPDEDTAELERQGYLPKAKGREPAANKARKAPENK